MVRKSRCAPTVGTSWRATDCGWTVALATTVGRPFALATTVGWILALASAASDFERFSVVTTRTVMKCGCVFIQD